MAVRLVVAAKPFDCATCDRFVQDGDLLAVIDVYLLCERHHLIRHGAPAAQGHTHTCDEHDHTVHHAADDCRPSNYCPEGCLF
jgi:hypothetical protein